MNALERLWYGNSPAAWLLTPLSGLFRIITAARRSAYRHGLLAIHRLPVPVIVVGNISVGGTGKTPLVIWLVEFLKGQGLQPGIISRGYGGRATRWPQAVTPASDPAQLGDEPVLLARRCACPVQVGPDRVAAARALLAQHACDILISDDGLQHYALARDIEIAVLDGARRLGNGHCLPAGPLREPPGRLRQVDLVVTTGVQVASDAGEYAMPLSGDRAYPLTAPTTSRPLASFAGQTVHAVAGIGNPARFFAALRAQGLRVLEHPFPDHYAYGAGDIRFNDDLPVLMTEKDAVKCSAFAEARHWAVPVSAELDAAFGQTLMSLLKRKRNG